MDEDFQFGELEQAQPLRQLRPDQNAQYAVEDVGTPATSDLAVYVDLDTLLEIETHAGSDTRVELGGVLLGGQFEDPAGRPFVVISESIRAEHYEATQGSFKFTHATWQEITRRRQELHPELRMVGWYHTHPDWGVFLSSMDLFICEHFFNRPLDLALVVDPCRQDRGYFFWTGDPHDPIRRAAGYSVYCSRHRLPELQRTVGELEVSNTMKTERSRLVPGPSPQSPLPPVIQVGPTPPPWQAIVVIGLLAMQFCLLAILGWRSSLETTPAAVQGGSADELLKRWELERQAVALESQQQLLATLAAKWDGTPQPLFEQLNDSARKIDELESHLRAHLAREREYLERDKTQQAELAGTKKRADSLQQQIARLHEELSAARLQSENQARTIAVLQAENGLPDVDWYRRPWVWGTAFLVALAAVLGLIARNQRTAQSTGEKPEFSAANGGE